MTGPLTLDLDTGDFDSLVEGARALIPQLAPGWTDHNVHDPGIMLLELAAWTADQQIYALARDRRDERTAFAAAVGLHQQGPQPAQGLLWPRSDPGAPPTWPNGLALPQGRGAALDGRDGPGFVLTADVTLTTARIAGLSVEPPGQASQAYPAQPPRGGIAPFGTPAAAGARLRLRLDGDLLPPGATGSPVLSLGVETDCPAIADSRARMAASVRLGTAELALPILDDGTRALAQPGAVLVDLSPLVGQPAVGSAELVLTLQAPLRPLPAKITRLDINVLPVQQLVPGTVGVTGTGLPDQTAQLPEGAVFDPAPTVVTPPGEDAWTRRDDLTSAGPPDQVFAFDPDAGLVRFGNGVNGAVPAAGAGLEIRGLATAGAQGLIPAGSAWMVQGVVGRFWNPQATTGGADNVDLAQLRRDTRAHAASLRPIVTDADLVAAAMAAQDLRVRRAEVLDGYEPGTCPRLAGAARTLVVLEADAGQQGSEPPAWLDILRRRIRPQLTLGDRVRIVRPAYVPVRLRATVTPAIDVSPAALQAALDEVLAERLRLIATKAGDAVWPLGLDLRALEVAGWLRRTPGVAAVRDVAVAELEGAFGAAASVTPHGLPVLVRTAGDITIGGAA
jgi:hypothetical protein